jgi:hypothetical protein
MKLLAPFLVLLVAATSSSTCNKAGVPDTCFKGKLEVKGICSNYTVRILEGNMDTTLYAGSWTDENTGKEYKKVFALRNPCSFPDNLAEGDEFYFSIDSGTVKDCAVCQAYYPTPQRKLAIKILTNPCTR